jgi:hypothetical protein
MTLLLQAFALYYAVRATRLHAGTGCRAGAHTSPAARCHQANASWHYNPTAVSLSDLHAAAQPVAEWPALAGAALALGVVVLKRKLG